MYVLYHSREQRNGSYCINGVETMNMHTQTLDAILTVR